MTTTQVPRMPATDTAVLLTDVCHVCHRRVLGAAHDGTWTVACAECRRLDRRLGQEYGLTQCTPLWGGSPGVARPNLHEALMRGLSFEQAGNALRWHHARRTLAMAATSHDATLLDVPGDDVDAARITRWAAWQAEFPATPDAVATAYQDYVRQVHPWIDSVEPRVADVSWLVGLLAS